MKNIKYCLSLVAGMNNCRIRVLSLFAALLAISQISFADTYYYYIDCRALDRTAFQINWVRNQDGSKTPTASLNDPESGIIKITTDFAVGNESSSKLKFDLSYTSNTVRVEHISANCLGSNNCIKLETGATANCDLQNGCSSYSFIKYTVYGATPVTNYTITPNCSNCSSEPSSATTIASNSYREFTVTPNSGYQLTGASCEGATVTPSTLSGTASATVKVSNPTQNSTLYITTAAVSSAIPVVRIGNKIKEENDYSVTVSGYVAENTGCSDITKFTVYYSNNSQFVNDGDNKAAYLDAPITASPSANKLYNFSISAASLVGIISNGETLYVKITATNGVGTSEYSDVVSLTYSRCANSIISVAIAPASKKVVRNTELEFTASVDNADATGVTYTWSGDASGTGSTKTVTMDSQKTITVTASESTCGTSASTSETYTVCNTELTELNISCPEDTKPTGEAVSITATATGDVDSWSWYVDGALVSGATTGTLSYTPTQGKNYNVRAVAYGCPDKAMDAVCTLKAIASFDTHNDVTINDATACDGNHEFTWSDMFVPTPTQNEIDIVNTTGGASVSGGSDFELVDGKMIWRPKNNPSGTYTYTFTAHKAGYSDASANFSITYTKTDTEQTINAITQTPDVSTTGTTPWTKITLNSGIPGASTDVQKIKWTVSDEAGIVVTTNATGTEAYFKGSDKDKYYTITAVGLTDTCGETAPQTTNISVSRTSEDCSN